MTKTTSYQYDALGRQFLQHGPLPGSVAYDYVSTTYYPSSGADAFRPQSVTRYVGAAACPAAGCVLFTTTYSSYDLFGTARQVVDPSGVTTQLQTDGRGRVTQSKVLGGAQGDEITTMVYNANDTLRSVTDGDGICQSFDYLADGRLRAKRLSSASLCGIVPINQAVGEVEVYGYTLDHPTFLASVTRKLDGTVHYQKTQTSSPEGRLSDEPSAIDAAKAKHHAYDPVGILTEIDQENCYVGSPSCTSEVFSADFLGRRTAARRPVAGMTSGATTGFGYETATQVFPAIVTAGDGTTAVTTAHYLYDDFGQLVELNSPNAGLTRWEYDIGGRLIKRRDGVGTADVSTTIYTRDDLGRLTYVDYDTEHPVDCGTADEGTPITDEQYVYDACPSPVPLGFTCSPNSKGRLVVATTVQYCHQGVPFKRRTWHNLSPTGRLSKETLLDDAGSSPYQIAYTYTLGGRLSRETNPISSAFGMSFIRSTSNGNILAVDDPSGQNHWIRNVAFKAFGPLASYEVWGDDATYRSATHDYNLDYSTSAITYRTSGGSPTGGFAYTRDATGRVTQRHSLFPTSNPNLTFVDRFFLYDQPGRLTCESSSLVTTCPASGASNLLAKYAYSNGADTRAPDDRVSVEYTTPLRSTTGPATYSYTANSDRLSAVTQGASTQTVFHDGRGRRISDDDNLFLGAGRGFYYLPNGRLGTVMLSVPHAGLGGDPCGSDLHYVTMSYDHRGRLVSMLDAILVAESLEFGQLFVPVTQYAYFYDTADRLVAWQTWLHNTSDSDTGHPHPWLPAQDYLHLFVGDQLVAVATLNEGTYASSVRALLPDELGSPGPSYPYAANWSNSVHDVTAYGMASAGLPFLLPGQIVTPTAVTAFNPSSCNGGAGQVLWVRDAIAVNGQRDYDANSGSYLEPDLADERHRSTAVTAYRYASQDPVSHIDPTGLWTDVGDTCAALGWKDEIDRAILDAAKQIWSCPFCALDGLKRTWIAALAMMEVVCTKRLSGDGTCAEAVGASNYQLNRSVTVCSNTVNCDPNIRTESDLHTVAIPLDNWLDPLCQRQFGCMPVTMAHEGLHTMWPMIKDHFGFDVTVDMCVDCNPRVVQQYPLRKKDAGQR